MAKGKQKMMSQSEKDIARPGNIRKTEANKARRAEKHERRIQKNRDKFREGMTVKDWKNRPEVVSVT